jgi:hypothetical protein
LVLPVSCRLPSPEASVVAYLGMRCQSLGRARHTYYLGQVSVAELIIVWTIPAAVSDSTAIYAGLLALGVALGHCQT